MLVVFGKKRRTLGRACNDGVWGAVFASLALCVLAPGSLAMATFTYEALNAAGKPQKGTVDAASSEVSEDVKPSRFKPAAGGPMPPASRRRQAALETAPMKKLTRYSIRILSRWRRNKLYRLT